MPLFGVRSFVLESLFSCSYSFKSNNSFIYFNLPPLLSLTQLVGAGRFSWLSVDNWDTIEDE
jgi:hypothetical protein